jgi:hypothetical protein
LPGQRRRLGAAGLAAAGLLLAAAGCEPGYYYGVNGGVESPLSPGQPGGYVGLAARREYEPPPRSIGSYFAAEGDLVGFQSRDSRGLTPLLVGSGGGKLGKLRLYVEGGAQLFGYLERYDHRVFSLFGLVGGGGAGVAFNDYVELHLQGRVLWSSPSTQIDIQKGNVKSEFLYFLGGLTLYIRVEPTPPRPVENPL